MNYAARCSVSVGVDAPFRAKQAGDTMEWTVPMPAVKVLGRPVFIHCYRSAACSVTIWEAELLAAVGRKTTGWFLVCFRLSFP